MIKLPQVTLVALTDLRIKEHIQVLNKSMEGIEFGETLLLSHEPDYVMWDEGYKNAIRNIQIAPLKSIEAWNRSVIYEMPKFIKTSHALLVHDDGYIINPSLWRDEWLELDFIGAPWPLPQDDYSYRSRSGKLQRVGNSVSLRSKKLMDLVATRPMEYHFGNNNEDGQICCWERNWLEEQGCKFAALEQAAHFSKEHEIPENVGLSTFAFHQVD